ncbi:hypothetical protein [Eleftheria terrae]|uniref:hypothetical protein n=1 Tax=Eleftheria terrae TaxID=1597781 RepID=UPI00263ADC28|nr:hypothetical protein [Eleftheria terrae]WKB51431.1 hypothetical protein N7L95_16675 [Eleftheria terrae]
MSSLDLQRQLAHLRFLAEGRDLVFGDPADCPLPPQRLAGLAPGAPEAAAVVESGLTARVFRVEGPAGAYAVKQARPACLVQNRDGETSFVNELQRHLELRRLREAGTTLGGISQPLYGSLRQGLLVSRWIDGAPPADWTERQLQQAFETGRQLLLHGFFEWDWSPGNLLDDGRQLWLFDFGYMYRFDPLHQFNSAGRGDDRPMFHLAERIETRNLFGWLLGVEREQGQDAALARFARVKEIAIDTYCRLRTGLAARGASSVVLDWLGGIVAHWQAGLKGSLDGLYLQEGWRSHLLDLEDDLSGRTCTPRTLERCDWLLRTVREHHATLQRVQALFGEDAGATRAQLLERGLHRRALAERYQVEATA